MPKTTAAKTDIADAPVKKAGGALSKPVKPSAELAAIVGAEPLPRTEVVSKVWDLHPPARPAGPGRQADHRRRRQADAPSSGRTAAPCSRCRSCSRPHLTAA